jgi:2,3,4,5-tetrahydropyridine-2,6-dicarboxylate N-succinyltransferase
MGVSIGASTPIVDRLTGEAHLGVVPSHAVVIFGALPGKPMQNGRQGPIVKHVDAGTKKRTSITELLRDSAVYDVFQ